MRKFAKHGIVAVVAGAFIGGCEGDGQQAKDGEWKWGDPPKWEAPKWEAPKWDGPKFAAPKWEAPKWDAPKWDWDFAKADKKDPGSSALTPEAPAAAGGGTVAPAAPVASSAEDGVVYDTTSTSIEAYVNIASRVYADAHQEATRLQSAIGKFLGDPTPEHQVDVKRAWLLARVAYGRTEAFQFSGSPETSRISVWPISESNIDYVQGDATAGIINDASVAIDRDTLIAKNRDGDAKNGTTGFQVIEFLIWGQDLYEDGPGRRPATDFDAGDAIKDRRRQFLQVATDLLVDDLKALADAWKVNAEGNYAATFQGLEQATAVSNMLSGLVALSNAELATARISNALSSGDQVDEQSRFSDNTHNDLLVNIQSLYYAYFGVYDNYRGRGINQLVAAKNADLNDEISESLRAALSIARSIRPPFDQIQVAGDDDPQRKALMDLSAKLSGFSDLIKQAGDALEAPVAVAGG